MEKPSEKLKFCAGQIKRLSCKSFFPTTKEAMEELVHTLNDYTASESHAKRVIDAAVIRKFGPEDRPEDRCPGPSDLWALCKDISAQAPGGNECSPGCPECGGSWWRTIEREDGISAAAHCDCGDRPASELSMKRYWEVEKRRIEKSEREAYGKWAAGMEEIFQIAVPAKALMANIPPAGKPAIPITDEDFAEIKRTGVGK